VKQIRSRFNLEGAIQREDAALPAKELEYND